MWPVMFPPWAGIWWAAREPGVATLLLVLTGIIWGGVWLSRVPRRVISRKPNSGPLGRE